MTDLPPSIGAENIHTRRRVNADQAVSEATHSIPRGESKPGPDLPPRITEAPRPAGQQRPLGRDPNDPNVYTYPDGLVIDNTRGTVTRPDGTTVTHQEYIWSLPVLTPVDPSTGTSRVLPPARPSRPSGPVISAPSYAPTTPEPTPQPTAAPVPAPTVAPTPAPPPAPVPAPYIPGQIPPAAVMDYGTGGVYDSQSTSPFNNLAFLAAQQRFDLAAARAQSGLATARADLQRQTALVTDYYGRQSQDAYEAVGDAYEVSGWWTGNTRLQAQYDARADALAPIGYAISQGLSNYRASVSSALHTYEARLGELVEAGVQIGEDEAVDAATDQYQTIVDQFLNAQYGAL